MQIIMMSMGHAQRMHSVALLAAHGLSATVVTHTREMANTIQRVADAHGVQVRVHCTGLRTLVENRNYALDLVDEGEWFIGIDDNIQTFTSVPDEARAHQTLLTSEWPPEGFSSWREYYRHPSSLLEACERVRSELERIGSFYGGFASMENPYFRGRQWSYARFVKSKAYVMQRQKDVVWKTNYLHDSHMSALAVARCGCVAVDNWSHPGHRMYESGGLGGDRQTKLAPELPEVLREFNGLVGKAKGENSALRFLLTQRKSIDRWREEHFYI
jgi:hypothetical protein